MHLFQLVLGFIICVESLASNFDPEYPNVSICVIPETFALHMDSAHAYKYLKRVIGLDKRCTHVYGNLHIRGLDRNANGTDPDLSFLESIEEISGDLVIHDNTIRRISLTNLKVIRGLTLSSSKYALEIYNNWRPDMPFLEEVDLRSLRVVMNKDIALSENHGLAYLHTTVDWNQIIEDPSRQQIKNTFTKAQTNGSKPVCHRDCQAWDGSGQHCFGPFKEQCQIRTKCDSIKGAKWCNFTNKTEVSCHSTCAGGCHGTTSGECAVCSSYYKKTNCTDRCDIRPLPVFGRDFSKDSKDTLIYTVGGLCTSKCPTSLLDQNKICIFQCDFKKYYRSQNRCIECQGDCKKRNDNCDLAKLNDKKVRPGASLILNGKLLKKLTNCTALIGQLYINDYSFRDEGVTIPMLHKHLSKVKEIYGELRVVLKSTPMSNLSFLSNLEEIRPLMTEHATENILTVAVESMKYLGLKKLRKVHGPVQIRGLQDHCYLNRIPWDEISPYVKYLSKCNETCHPLCTKGCWGPGNDLCYSCEYRNAGEFCVEQCTDAAGFYTASVNVSSNTNVTECRKCHPLCKQNCTGPTAKECRGQCKFASENGTCVDKCSPNTYQTTLKDISHQICKPCHPLCHKGNGNVCSGPGDYLGDGGCGFCEKIISSDTNRSRCHKGPCPSGFLQTVIAENLRDDNRVVQQSSCERCHPLCSNCTGLGNNIDECSYCKGYIYDRKCIAACPQEVENYTLPIAIGSNCPRCHPQCKNGCSAINDHTKCNKCSKKKLYDGDKFSCVETCPAGRNYTEFRDGELVCLTLFQKKVILFIAIGCTICLAMLVLGFVIYLKWKSNQALIKAEIKAIYSNYKEPNMKNMKEDHFMRPPNMKRLQMIPLCDLIFDTGSKPLGSGAFGKVYRGYWKVPRSDNKLYSLDVVIKVIHNSTKTSTDEFLEEAKIMASVTHRHCLPLIGVCFSLDKPCLVSTYAEFGSLDKYLHQHGRKISSYSMLIWAEQIADGMAYLNMRNIIHRDLAARNILVNSKNIIQITDFGLARLVEESEDSIVVKSGRVPIRWLALETLLHATYSSATDVWAYGVTLWEIFTYGKRPYENLETNEIKTYLQQGNRLCQPEICTLDVYMVMIKCWLDDPHMRPTFTELMSTFEQFALTPQRFLYLPHEHINSPMNKTAGDPRSHIPMHQISIDSDLRQISLQSNKSDEMSWGPGLHNDSAYHLISNSYGKDHHDDHAVLPSRKKTKRNISMEKIRSFSKFDFNKLLSSKLQRDSKSYNYQGSNNYEGTKTTCTSFDSASPLVTQRLSDYESHKKDVRPISDVSAKIDPFSKTPERIFVDKQLSEETKALLPTPMSKEANTKPPNLPPIDIPKLHSQNHIEKESINSVAHTGHHSPDSGNSHNFDIDDYLVPSHISSAGYYNVTPSPSSIANPSMAIADCQLLINNADYLDDGYLEPVKTNR